MKNEKDILFLETFQSLLKQGYAIDNIFHIINITNPTSKTDLLQSKLQEGTALAQALLEIDLPDIFNEYFSFFIKRDSIDEAIALSLNIVKMKTKIKEKLYKELAYPVILIVFLFVFSIFVISWMIPALDTLFISFEIEKSIWITCIFAIFKILPFFMITITLSLILCIAYVIYAIKKQQYRKLDLLISKTHLIGKYIKKYFSMKFALYYNELYKAGFDATEIIEVLNHQVLDSNIKMLIYEIYCKIEGGRSLMDSIEGFDYFEDLFKYYFMMLLKTDTHINLDEYLSLSFKTIEQEMHKSIKILTPSIYAFVAVFIVTIYIAVIMPMMNIINTL